ncbi:MAG: glycosyltransferase family 39 protein [Holophagales bacterium]|nr:glycosyltransferase family 39 protein [Holophagales bacterium]
MMRPLGRAAAAGAVLLALLGALLAVDHQRLDSATMDEPFHALAGCEYALSGTYWANLEHPPLAKLLAGVSAGLAGARPPRLPAPFSFRTAESPQPFLYQNEIPPERLLAAARRPFPLLFVGVVLLASFAAWRAAGPVAGLGTALLLAFEPTLVAHAAFLHTDVVAALGFLATVVAAHRALMRPSALRWAGTGLLLGLSLSAKFTAVFLVPILLVLVLVRLLAGRRETGRFSLAPLGGLLLASGVAGAVLLGVYAVSMRNMPSAEAERSARYFLLGRLASSGTVERVARISRLLPPAGHYVAGLAGVAEQNRRGGGINVFRREVSIEGFPSYFPVAFLVKSSVGYLAALLVAAGLVAARRVRPGFGALVFLLPPAYVFLASAASSYNIGVRHVLPAVPLLAVASTVAITRGFSRNVGAAVLAGLGLLQAGETLAVHPHEISFFNVAAGGPSRGHLWLNDSNLDWGQDLVRLARELERRGDVAGTTVAYFGGADPRHDVPKARLFDAATTPLTPGLYAVSSFLLAAGPELMAFHGDVPRAVGYQRLRRALAERGTREGRVGYSILLYRLPEERTPPP